MLHTTISTLNELMGGKGGNISTVGYHRYLQCTEVPKVTVEHLLRFLKYVSTYCFNGEMKITTHPNGKDEGSFRYC